MLYKGHRFMVIDLVNSEEALRRLLLAMGCDHWSNDQALNDLFEGCEFYVGDQVKVTEVNEITLQS